MSPLLPPNPDPANVFESNPAELELYPSGNVPPHGIIFVVPRAQYADGQGFTIDDGSANAAVTFVIQTTAAPPAALPGAFLIDISGATTPIQTGAAIAAAINEANAGGLLAVAASASPGDGRVYLVYDFTSELGSDGNGVQITESPTMPPGTNLSWTAGGATNDVRNLQWALRRVAPGGKVRLKRRPPRKTSPPFEFGTIGRVEIGHDVDLVGEDGPREDPNAVGSGGWVKDGAIIRGGTQLIVGPNAPVRYSIRDIIFDGFYAGALRVAKSAGECEISGCQFRNFVQGTTVSGGVRGAFPIVVDGGMTMAEAEDCGGSLKIANNFFGAPVAGTDPVTPADGTLNNLMHFSNCRIDLEISGCMIEDCVWGGFLVYGNMGSSTITGNTIRKSRSFVYQGVAISIGATVEALKSDELHTGPTTVSNNEIAVSSPNSAAILITAYPGGPLIPPVHHRVQDNVIKVENAKAALACRGDCAHTQWRRNKVTGSGRAGIWVTHSVPPAPFAQLPLHDALRPSHNTFANNDLSGFTASVAEVLVVDADENNFEDNEYGAPGWMDAGMTHHGLAGAYVVRSSTNEFRHETFRGNYPGLSANDPVPCVWIAGAATDNRVMQMHHDTVPQGADVCEQVYCADPVHNKIAGYVKCVPTPGNVIVALADKEQMATTVFPELV